MAQEEKLKKKLRYSIQIVFHEDKNDNYVNGGKLAILSPATITFAEFIKTKAKKKIDKKVGSLYKLDYTQQTGLKLFIRSDQDNDISHLIEWNEIIDFDEEMEGYFNVEKEVFVFLFSVKLMLKPSPNVIPKEEEKKEAQKANVYNNQNDQKIKDKFDSKFIGEEHDLNGNIITHSGGDWVDSSSFATKIIETGKFEWKFRIKQMKEFDDCGNWSICIGIWKVKSSQTPPINTYFTKDGNNNFESGYGFVLNQGFTLSSYGVGKHQDYAIKCKTNDIIEMVLDLDDLTLKYIINNKDFGVAYNVKKGQYRAAVCTPFNGNAVEML